MDFEFVSDDLKRLYTDRTATNGRPPGIVKAFRKRMQAIRNAKDERDFYQMKAWRFEKLTGDRAGQYSMRLNDQYRLILEMVGHGPDKRVLVIEIDDYH